MTAADAFFSIAFIACWAFGVALASGFWMTLFAAVLPPVGCVILAQRLIERLA